MLDIFLKKNVESGIKKLEKRKREFLTYKNMRTVLILFDYSNWNEIAPIVKDLEQNGKQVFLWTILQKSDAASPQTSIPQKVKFVDVQKDVNWKKVLRSEIIEDFSRFTYDALLDLSFDDDNYMTILRTSCSTRFNVGFRELDYNLFEFIILKDEYMSLFEAYEQMKIYQEHIQQN